MHSNYVREASIQAERSKGSIRGHRVGGGPEPGWAEGFGLMFGMVSLQHQV